MSIISDLSTTKWFRIGPAPIDTPTVGLGTASGRIEVAAPHPVEQDTMYLGANGGGVWKTGVWTNAQNTVWLPFTDDQRSLNFSGYHTLVVHPADHSRVLGVVSGTGAGILKSTDNGLGWELLGNGTFEGASIGAIAVDPTDKKTLYVSVWYGGPGGGVYKSTDGGLNWTNMTPFHGGAVSDVIIARYNPNVLYAGLVNSLATNGVWRSSDGGKNWKNVGPLSSFFLGGAVRLESGSSKGRVYVSLFGYDSNGVFGIHRYRTHDDAKTWQELRATSGIFENRSWHLVLAVDPKDDDHIIVNDAYALFESTDAGRHWQSAETMGDDYVNATFDAADCLVVTADRSVYRRAKKSKKWSVHVGNLAVTLFYDITLDPNDPDVVYGVAQDHPSAMKFHTFNPWEYIPAGGETGKLLVDPTNSKRLYISAPLRPERFVQRSNDGGHHWKTILNVTAFDDEDYNLAYAVQKSFVMDPSNGKRLLVGTNKVFETKNARTGTPTWNAISHILSPSGDVANQYITTLAIAPSDAKTVYAATSDGHLWITTNGGTKWKRRDNGLFGAGGTVLDIRIDPGNASHGYAVSAYTAGVWELNQTGSTFQWTNISGDLPTNVSGLCIAVDWRYSIPALYVGTTRGVYHSVNNGGQWKIFGADLPNTMVMDLETLDAKHVLAAATFGRGTWEILISPSRISGRVFEDLDGNGVHDPNDPGMEGVIVFLDVSGNNRLEKFQFRTTTGAAGHYVFDSVPPGKYAVRQIVPNAFVQTTVNPQRIRVGGSQVEGQNFGNQPMKAGIGSKEFLHRAQLHYLPGRQIGQAIGAKGEFARSMQAGRKRRDMRHA